jgi:hypothetical protein
MRFWVVQAWLVLIGQIGILSEANSCQDVPFQQFPVDQI